MALVLAGLPVLALCLLLGGVIPEALVILTVVSLAICVVGCALAFALSVRATSTHEVLMVVFAAWAVWLLAAPLWRPRHVPGSSPVPRAGSSSSTRSCSSTRPTPGRDTLTPSDVVVFVSVCLVIAMVALALSILNLRKELAPRGRRSERLEALGCAAKARLFSWWPSPSLDGNPVLWREWHRNRPSRMGQSGHDALPRRDRDRLRRRHRRRHPTRCGR